MKTKFRVKAKKALKLSHNLLVKEITVENFDEQVKEMTELYKRVASKADFNLGAFNLATYKSLKEKLGEKGFLFCVNKLSDYKLAKGATYKSDYGAINSWVIKEWDKQQINGKEKLTGAAAFLNQLKF